MDLELSNVKYWENYLKKIDTKFGYIEKYNTILTCDKKNSTLCLYQKKSKNKFKFIKNYDAFTGKIKGDKKKEGDLRTPIGIYNLTKKIYKLDSFYGPLAFVTSYPNIYDNYKGKNGSGIWIHGLPKEKERDEYTKGCIAINNLNIKALDKQIDIDKTILIIDSKKIKQKLPKKQLSAILAGIYKWRYSWLYNDIDSYLSFYAKTFVREDGMKYDRFKKYKTRVFKKGERKKIIFKNISVIPYPNSSNIFEVTFREYYKSDSYKFEGDKVLMIKLDKQNKFKIFTEK
jgi:murein L,D-transpeptidase YafK